MTLMNHALCPLSQNEEHLCQIISKSILGLKSYRVAIVRDMHANEQTLYNGQKDVSPPMGGGITT